MPFVIQKKRCHIPPSRAFEIVKDFQSYPVFLPWCSASRLQSSQKAVDNDNIEIFIADLIIKYTVFTEVFTTKVTCNYNNYHIDIDYIKGAFKHLKSYWRFMPVHGHSEMCDIEFMIDFSMKFTPLQKIMEIFFEEAMLKMIVAFEERFKALA